MNKTAISDAKLFNFLKTQFCFRFIIPIGILLLGQTVNADVVILKYGNIAAGKILQDDSEGVQIQTSAGAVHYPASMVEFVRKDDPQTSTNRIPSWVNIISQLTTNEWAHEFKQIPATVIDDGILKNVPYISFRCNSGGYEINIYGDPEKPACVEIGAITYLVKNSGAKSNCVDFICSILSNEDDKKLVRGLKWNPKDVQKTNSWTFEVTLPDETDSYGGWWISAYNEDELQNARASGDELLSITQPKTKPAIKSAVVTPAASYNWSSQDISTYSRPSKTDLSDEGGKVYVNGYYRKSGTYVHGYWRRK